jgi:hypothetical protein
MWRVQFVAPPGQRAVNMTINQKGMKLSGPDKPPAPPLRS